MGERHTREGKRREKRKRHAPFQARVAPEKLFPVEFTASQLLDIVDGLEVEDTGRFIDWAGIDVEY